MGFLNRDQETKCSHDLWIRFIEGTGSTVKRICDTPIGSAIYKSKSNQLNLDKGPQEENTDNVLLCIHYVGKFRS